MTTAGLGSRVGVGWGDDSRLARGRRGRGLRDGPGGRLLDRLFLERPRTIANRELDRLVELVSSDG